MTIIKICGLCTVEHTLKAARLGANLVGVVFAPSRRKITPEQACAIVAALREDEAGRNVQVVGLFVNEPPDIVASVASECNLDYVQLSGDEPPEQAQGIDRPVIKTLRLDGSPTEQRWLDLMQGRGPDQTDRRASVHLAPCPLIVDAHVPGAYGGTGQVGDWGRAAALARQQDLMLAGGLHPGNVAAALEQVRPRGVDVSSGVETDGMKDPLLIEAFIQAVRSVNRSSRTQV